MEDFLKLKIYCSQPEEIVAAKNAVVRTLPPNLRKALNKVFLTYLRLYDVEGVFERFNDRTVGMILAEFDGETGPAPIEEGEIDGMKFKLFAPRKQSEEPLWVLRYSQEMCRELPTLNCCTWGVNGDRK